MKARPEMLSQHPGQGTVPITTTTEAPRSFHGKIARRF